MLRSANVEGEVLAQFVVDTTGHVDMSSFKVLKTTHDLFTNSVKQSLPNMKFSPAVVGGRKVKQLVQMTFPFSLSQGASIGPAIQLNAGNKPAVARGGRGKPETKLPPGVYFEYQVEKAVCPRSGESRAPIPRHSSQRQRRRSPCSRNSSSTKMDMADSTSFAVLRSTHELFTECRCSARSLRSDSIRPS